MHTHTDAFPHRDLHENTLTHRRFYTQTLLHTDTDAFPHRPFYTQTLLHTNTFTHIRFYTRTLLHANTFTYRRFYTQTLLHSDTFTHRRFSTQTLLHADASTETFTQRRSQSAAPLGDLSCKQSCVHVWAQERGKEVNYACRCRVAQSTAKHLLSDFQTENTTHEFDMTKNHCRRDLQTEGWTHQQKTSLTKLGNKKLSSSATPSYIISQCLVSSCIILDFQTENTIREFDTWDGHHCRTPWCCKLHESHRSWRKHPQRYNEPNSLVTSTTSCTNLLHTRTIQCKECVLRSLRPRLLRLTSKHHCRIDMQTEQWSSLWTSQFPHRLSHQTNQAPHVLARIH